MPHYFLHRWASGELIKDPEGAEFPDLQAAVDEAFASARDLLAAKLLQGEVLDGERIEIWSVDGEKLTEVLFKDAMRIESGRPAK